MRFLEVAITVRNPNILFAVLSRIVADFLL
jgi:hypothetical protein